MPAQRSSPNHVDALALYFMFCHLVRIHKTLKVTPAMADGLTRTRWTMEDVAERIETLRLKPGLGDPPKKRAGAQ